MADRFQSTLPLRGATRHVRNQQAHRAISIHTPLAGSDQAQDDDDGADGISIHTPLAGSDSDFQRKLSGETISIHTPLAGSDPGTAPSSSSSLSFQSTLPLRGATTVHVITQIFLIISIHTPLAGSDPAWKDTLCHPRYFNPHSPCGERPQK